MSRSSSASRIVEAGTRATQSSKSSAFLPGRRVSHAACRPYVRWRTQDGHDPGIRRRFRRPAVRASARVIQTSSKNRVYRMAAEGQHSFMNVISVRRPDIVVDFAEGWERDLPVGVRALCVGVHTWVGLPTSLRVALARKWRPVIRTFNGSQARCKPRLYRACQ